MQDQGFPPSKWQGYDIIGKGANRVCVIDPLDAHYCLKFTLPHTEKSAKNWRQLLRQLLNHRLSIFDENAIEWHAYQRLHQRIGQDLQGKIAACIALEQHPEGMALKCEYIQQGNNHPAPSIYHLITQQKNTYTATQLCLAVDVFIDWLLYWRIPLFDINAGNLVVVENDAQDIHLVCIDVKSSLIGKELLPISYWSKFLMKRKILRRSERLKQRIHEMLLSEI